MRIHTACGDDHALTGDNLRCRADNHRNIWLYVRVARLADACDEAVFQADIGFHDTPMVEDYRVGDHGVHHIAMRTL